MTDAPRFCTTCGSPLGEGTARFCTGCGKELTTAPVEVAPVEATATAPDAPAIPATAERVISVIPNARLKVGMMGLKCISYTLVLTERRIIFAEITSAMLKQAVADAREEAAGKGKGFFGQWGAQLGAYGRFAEAYLEKEPEASLAENPRNFAIENQLILSAKLKAGDTDADGATMSEDRLIIRTAADKHRLVLGSGLGQARKALQAAELI